MAGLMLSGLVATPASAHKPDGGPRQARLAAPTPAGPRDYFYDAAGQLAGVVDESGGSAAYRYDDAGNVKATERLPVDALVIFALVPARGPIGSTVEISGTGFRTGTTDNAVTVDGIAAQVTAATAVRLTVVIPTGATEGVVRVTTGGRTTQSPRSFRVEAGTPAPAIAAISTDRGNKNDLVTITGSGFDPDKTRDVVMFHRTVAKVQAASATSLTVQVPAAASSGRISVRTPGGTAQSATEFLVAPRGFTMNNLVYGGRIGVGKPAVTATVPSGKAALLLFNGTAGELLNLRFEGNTIPTRSALWLYSPYGGNFARSALGDPLDLWAGGALSQDLPKLTATGTYALVIDPNDDASGLVKITASNTLTGSRLTADGSGVPFQITAPQQAVEFPFAATAGQWLSLGLTDISEPKNTFVVKATAPDGSSVTWQASLTRYTPTMVYKPKQTGAYKLSISFGPNELGFGRVWLSTVINGEELIVNGATSPVSILRPGQSVRLPFNGTPGQVLQLGYTENTLQDNERPAYPTGIMVEPDDVQVELNSGWAEARDIPTLRKAGQHALFLSGWHAVGTVNAWLSTAAEGGKVPINSKRKVTVDRPGRDVWLDYDGVKDRPLYLTTSDKSLAGEVNLRLYRPDGRLVGLGRYIDVEALPLTGKYRIQVDPESPGKGDVSIVAVEPSDAGSISSDGAAVPATVSLPGQRVVARFTGQVGQRLTLGGASDFPWVNLKILKPDNTNLDYFGLIELRRGQDLPALPVTGEYRIVLTPYQEAVGNVSMMLYGDADGGKAQVDGAPLTIRFEKPAQDVRVAFDATANEALEFEVDGLLWSTSAYYTVLGPDGAVLQARTYIPRRSTVLPAIRATGTHILRFDVYGGAVGPATVRVRHRPPAVRDAPQADRKPTTSQQATPPPCPTPAQNLAVPSAPAIQQPGQPADPAGEQQPQQSRPKPGCDDTGWRPTTGNLAGEGWVTGRDPVPTRERALQFPVGITGVVGKVLTTEGQPLAKVTVGVGNKRVTTDARGRFALTGVPGGHLSLRVDGRSAGTKAHPYGVFDIGVDVTRGEVLVLPYTVFLPELDRAHTVQIDSPTTKDVVLTTRAIPGLEVHVPAGTVIRDADGKVATEISLTAIPIDRPPFPLPPTRVPVYFTVQPGGGVLFPEGARVIYPNYTKEPPGTRTQFWNYDPDGKGWHIYGLGRVSRDGKQIVPDPGVKFYRLTGAMTAVPGMNPAAFAPRANGLRIGDPVDPATGLLVEETVDLTITDVMPIEIKRTYQQGDADTRSFGIGTSFDYGMFPWSPGTIGNFDFQQFDLVQPDGSKIHYRRSSPGKDYAGAIFAADPTPTRYDGSIVRWNGDGWDVELRDGTVLVLGDEAPMQEVRDKFGNTTTITRATAPPGTDGKVRLNGAITQITSPSGRWVRFGYDSTNPPKVTRIEDNLGRSVSYTYYPTGHLKTVTNTDNGVTTYTWDANGRLKTITDPRKNEVLVNEYDPAGRVKTQKAADGGLTEFDYVAVNGVVTETKVTDPRKHVRRLTFTDKGQVVTDTEAYGTALAQTTTYEYDASGVRKAATVDPLKRRTTYDYNAAGQVQQVTTLAGTPESRTEKFEYNGPHGELTRHTDSYNKDTVYEIDGRGAVRSVTDPMQRKTIVDVDGSGLVTSVTDPALKTTTTDYVDSDPVKVTDPLGRVTRAGFDPVGRQIWAADARGAVTDTSYDGSNRVRSVTDPLGRTVILDYDANGNRKTFTDGRRNVTAFDYDSMNRVKTITDPAKAVESFEYDRNGNLKTHTSRRKIVTEQDFDALDRLDVKRFGSESTVRYGYDSANRLRRVEDSAVGVTTVDYDDVDRIKQETTPHGSVSYEYSAIVRDRTMTFAGHAPVRHLYDANGNLQEVQHGGTAVTTVSRDAAGRPKRSGAPGAGVNQTTDYTDAGQIKSTTYRVGDTVLGELGYEYDSAGQRTRTTGSYSRTALPAAFGPANYDNSNRLDKIGDTSITYDADGNLSFDGTTTYAWNARGELSTLTREGLSVSFQYAADGRRLDRTINGATTNYLYDGDNPLQEKVGGTVTATMTSAGIDGFHLREAGGVTRRYLTDALGSTVGLVDDAGVGASYTYEPFGKTTVTGDDGGNPYRFTGREDDGSGLYYYRQRYYSPVLQRFISEDPIGLAGGVNLHAYVDNRPTEVIDPTGEAPAYGPLDRYGRATGVDAILTRNNIGGKTNPQVDPAGWAPNMGYNRSHLLGAQLGGSNTERGNFVTMYQYANSPVMRGYERQVRLAVERGQTVEYRVTPIYRGRDPLPRGVTIRAQGSGGFNLFVTVLNRMRR